MKSALLIVLLLLLIVLAALACERRATRAGRARAAPRDARVRGARQGGAGPSGARSGGAGPAEETPPGLEWPDRGCLTRRAVDDCRRAVARARGRARGVPGGFGPAPPGERAELAAAAARLAATHGPLVTEPFVLALRDLAVNDEVRRSGVRALRHGEEIRGRHERGETVCSIAARLRLPPMAVLRQLLAEGGQNPREIRALLARPEGLPAALRAELPRILEADFGSAEQGARTKARSEAFEAGVGAFLRAKGVGFATEDDLRARRAAGEGPSLTPDFLLSAPITIAGRPVHWIDAKNYPAVDSPLTAKSIASQVARYTAAFGPGALVFNGGVMCGTDLASRGEALVLDGTPLDKNSALGA